MFLRLPIDSVRRFAALLLLLGVMLGGTVDAVACAPVSEVTAAAAVGGHEEGDQHQLPGDERHGDCVHGHCHHGAQTVPPLADQSELLRVRTEHLLAGTAALVSIPPDTLKRPPRA